MRVLFLDIDGVMNSQIFYRERYKKRWVYHHIWWPIKKFLINIKLIKSTSSKNYKLPEKYYTYEHQVNWLKKETDPQKWVWLSEFCNENDIKICISSVWKNHFRTKEEFHPEWWDKALTELGFKEGTFVGITGDRRTLRGTEIQEWLDSRNDVDDYVILDDESDMLEHQLYKFHHVDSWYGLSPNHLYRIKRHFNKESNYIDLVKRKLKG